MWIEGRNHTLLNLNEVLCFELQQEFDKRGCHPDKKPTGGYLIKAYSTHRSRWGKAEITMFIGSKEDWISRIEYLRAKLGLVGHDRINIG